MNVECIHCGAEVEEEDPCPVCDWSHPKGLLPNDPKYLVMYEMCFRNFNDTEYSIYRWADDCEATEREWELLDVDDQIRNGDFLFRIVKKPERLLFYMLVCSQWHNHVIFKPTVTFTQT